MDDSDGVAAGVRGRRGVAVRCVQVLTIERNNEFCSVEAATNHLAGNVRRQYRDGGDGNGVGRIGRYEGNVLRGESVCKLMEDKHNVSSILM